MLKENLRVGKVVDRNKHLTYFAINLDLECKMNENE